MKSIGMAESDLDKAAEIRRRRPTGILVPSTRKRSARSSTTRFTVADHRADKQAMHEVFPELTEDVIGYETEIERHPDDVGLHDDAALLYLELGRTEPAIAHFTRSLAL